MRRLILVFLFVGVLLTVLVGGHLYLARRLVLDLALGPPLRNAALLTIALLSATLFLQPIAERTLPRRVGTAIAWPASLWMGLAFYLLVLLAASDVLAMLLGAVVELPAGRVTAARVRALGVLALAGAAGASGLVAALRGPRLRRIEVRLPRWPAARDGYRIVQITDLHLGPLLDRRFAAAVVADANALAPDLVAVTGDLVDGSVERVGAEAAPLGELARAGRRLLRHREPRLLLGRRRVGGAGTCPRHPGPPERARRRSARDAAAFDLAGVEDHHAHLVSARHREDVPGALAGRDAARPVVLLAHDPHDLPDRRRAGRRPPALRAHPRRADLALRLPRPPGNALRRRAPPPRRRRSST